MELKEQIKKENIKNYYKNKYKNKNVINQYYKKINNNKIDQIFNSINKRLYKALLKQNINKKYTYLELLGCDLLEFELDLINKLKEGMTLENYGEWEIDHIRPISLFNLNNNNELFNCCNYNNLQPLWKKENIIKSNKCKQGELSDSEIIL
jgi:hypothetical protein